MLDVGMALRVGKWALHSATTTATAATNPKERRLLAWGNTALCLCAGRLHGVDTDSHSEVAV